MGRARYPTECGGGGPARGQRQHEDDHRLDNRGDLIDGTEAEAEQPVLQPQHRYVVNEIDAVGAFAKGIEDVSWLTR